MASADADTAVTKAPPSKSKAYKKFGVTGASKRCKVPNCLVKRGTHKNHHFFRFPKDMERCQFWIDEVDNKDLIRAGPEATAKNPNAVICQEHFDYKWFCSDSLVKMKLREGAVPTLNLYLPGRSRLQGRKPRTGKRPVPGPKESVATVLLAQPPPKGNGLSDEQYEKVLQTCRYINQQRLDQAKRRGREKLRLKQGDREWLVDAADATVESLEEGGEDVGNVRVEEDDVVSVGECAALLDDDPPGTSNSGSRPKSTSPSKKRMRFAPVYSVEDLDKELSATNSKSSASRAGECISLLHDDPEDLPQERTTAKAPKRIYDSAAGSGEAKNKKAAAIQKVVSSVQQLVKLLHDGQFMNPDDREPVCLEVVSHTVNTKFEIDIQCSADGQHKARMLSTKQ